MYIIFCLAFNTEQLQPEVIQSFLQNKKCNIIINNK